MQPTRTEFLDITQPEKYLFYFLIYLSLAIMAYQIFQRAKIWIKGKPIWWSSKGSQAIGLSGDQATEGGAGEAQSKVRYGVPDFKDAKRWIANVGVFIIGQKKVKSSRTSLQTGVGCLSSARVRARAKFGSRPRTAAIRDH